MNKLIKLLFRSKIIILFAIFLLSLKPALAVFQYNDSFSSQQADVAQICDLETIFKQVVGISGILVGFVFFIMMILGGVRFLMSGGDPKAVASAKGTLTWSILGLAFFALSYTILILIRAFTGVDVTNFAVYFDSTVTCGN